MSKKAVSQKEQPLFKSSYLASWRSSIKSNLKSIDLERIKDGLVNFYQIIRTAYLSFQIEGGTRGAAGMAYYTLFSLFPLLIVMVTLGSFFVDGIEASNRAAQLVSSVIPVSQQLVEVNISRFLVLRNSVGALGVLVLLWSGSNAFSMMVHNINSAWPKAEQRSFFQRRMLGLAMVVIIILVLFVLMLSSTILDVLYRYSGSVPGLDLLFSSRLWTAGTRLMYWIVPFLFFYSLYRIIPMGRVPIRSAGFTALGITIAWRTASSIFRWYLASGLARYEIIFGSLSAIVVLLLWIYISSLILFFGAHVCAASMGKVELEPSSAWE